MESTKDDKYPNVGRDCVNSLLAHLRGTQYRIEGKLDEAKMHITAIALILEISTTPELLERQASLVAREERLRAKLEKTSRDIKLIESAIA